jgi:curved DNA-binding protein CbpA
MQNPFLHLHTVEAVKKEFRALAFVHHPDHGGTDADFRDLNRMYQDRLSALDGAKSTDENGKEHTYTYNVERETAVAEKLAATIAALPHTVTVWLIGIYLWCQGDTKAHRETLKVLGYRWSPNRGMWYWKPADYKSRRSRYGMDHLAAKYGASVHAGAYGERDLLSA